MRPQTHEHPPYMSRYIDLVTENDVLAVLRQQTLRQTLESIGEEKSLYRYAEGKWSIRQLAGHIVDCERIFAFRALCFARGEKQSLPGFDEDDYVAAARFDKRTLSDLLAEYSAVREATLRLFGSFDETALSATGNANGRDTSVRALVYITAGHERHHVNVLREKYLS
jgi:uncharacterized damage-inducible protein DinB